MRTLRSLDTLIDYLRTDLGIVKIDGLDASGHSAAAVHNRPDVAGRMRAAHAGLPKIAGQTLKEMIGEGRM